LVHDVPGKNTVGFRINNAEYMKDKVVGINLGRLDQLKPVVVCNALGNVIQSNDSFGLRDRLEVDIDSIRMSADNGVVNS
jgi:hypothetical protein